jgi:glycosyltransferase involved in cell wall biosynthesis
MARKLVARGHQVTMVCGQYDGAETGLSSPFDGGERRGVVDGIDVVEFQIAYSNKDGFLKRAVLFIKYAIKSTLLAVTEPYDLLFATSTPLTACIPGIVARWFHNKPFVFEVRDLWPELPRAMGVITNPAVLWLMGVLEWAAYHSSNRLIGLSPGIIDGIARRGVDRSRITLIPNGCDIEIFSGPQVSWRPEGVSQSDFLALFAGTHGVANGLDAVIAAAAVLKRRGHQALKFVLIGDGKLKPMLQREAAERGLDNIVFCPPVSKDRLAGLTSSADIGLQILADVPAFYYGTSPNKFFDYIAAGLPVLNNYPGWLADMIHGHETGVVVQPRNPEAFADALIEASSNPERLRRWGRNARGLAATFDRDRLSDAFAEWLEGTVDCPNAEATDSPLVKAAD